jgi:hypothetical protein
MRRLFCRGTDEFGEPRQRRASLLEARDTTAFARPPPRYVTRRRNARRPLCEVSALFTTDKQVSRGTAGAALVLQTKNSAPSPPGISKLSFVSAWQRLRRGWKQKTPPEHRLGRGSKLEHFGTGSAHSASARKRARTDALWR